MILELTVPWSFECFSNKEGYKVIGRKSPHDLNSKSCKKVIALKVQSNQEIH